MQNKLKVLSDEAKRSIAETVISKRLRQEFGRMHVYCYSNSVCLFDWGSIRAGVMLESIDHTKPDELLDRLRTAWVQHLITGEMIEA